MKKDVLNKHCVLLIIFLGPLFMSGCSFFRLEKELQELDQIKVLSGQVTGTSDTTEHLIVLLFESGEDGVRLARSHIVGQGSGRFAIETGIGNYYLAAFEDLNNNLSHEEHEPAAVYGKPDKIVVTPGAPATLLGLDMELEQKPEEISRIADHIAISPDTLGRSFITLGQVIDFNDPRLAGEFGGIGYWEPLTFIREIGFCLFFLEQYDPQKIPVVFVHGALGTPLGWQESITCLDRQRFQPWLYYYPSGLRLEQSGNALHKMVASLYRHYGFSEIHVVAQSMGGLVARSFIQQISADDRSPLVKSFISISTPWNGHKMSAHGVASAPAVIPSWYDMTPNSSFIEGLYERSLPDSLNHYLLFSYKGDCSLMLENNDGTVELSSQLDWRAQSGAARLLGYDEDHGSILEATRVLKQIALLLNQEDRRSK